MALFNTCFDFFYIHFYIVLMCSTMSEIFWLNETPTKDINENLNCNYFQ